MISLPRILLQGAPRAAAGIRRSRRSPLLVQCRVRPIYADDPNTVLSGNQAMLSDILVKSRSVLADEPHEIVLWRIGLDIVLPIVALLLLYKLIDIGANRAQRVRAPDAVTWH
jgi:hypothetical protein